MSRFRPRGLRPKGLAAFVAPLLGLVCGACNLLMDLSTSQCATNDDCRALGDGLVCADHSCLRQAETVDTPDTGSATTTTPDASTDADAAPACTSSEQCADGHYGEPWRCVHGQCVPLKSGVACPFVVEPSSARNDNALVLGAFLPLGGAAPLAQPLALTYQLTLSEISRAGGLPGGTGSSRRPIVAVFCDSDPAVVEQGVAHLANDLEVPAVTALFSQTDATRFFQDYFLPKGIFMLNPQDTTEALKRVDGQRLMWHLLGTPEEFAAGYRPLVARTESYVRGRKALSPSTPVRLAVVAVSAPTEESILNVIRDPAGTGMVLNGAPVVPGAANFLSLKIPSLETDPTADLSGVAADLAAFRPDIVVALTSALELPHIVPALDRALATDAGASSLPVYVLGPRNASVPELKAYIGNPDVEPAEAKRRRFLGLQYAGAADPTERDRFRARYAEAYPQVDPHGAYDTDNFYDAFYWLAYGFFAAGPGAPVKGSSFAEGVRKLLSGPSISGGPVTTISEAFITLSTSTTGGTFRGALGTPSFDVASGAAHSVASAYCYTRDGVTGLVTPKFDVLRYDPATSTLQGDDFCFVGY